MKGQRPSLPRILIAAALVAALGIVVYVKKRPPPERGSAPVKAQAAAGAQQKAPEALPRLVDLGSNKCRSCLAMVPVLEALAGQYGGRLEVLFIDVWKEPDEAERHRIHLIPTQIFFDANGKELFRHEGFFSEEDILAKWKELGFGFDG